MLEVSVYMCMHVIMYVYLCVCMSGYVGMWGCMSVSICLCVCAPVFMCVCSSRFGYTLSVWGSSKWKKIPRNGSDNEQEEEVQIGRRWNPLPWWRDEERWVHASLMSPSGVHPRDRQVAVATRGHEAHDNRVMTASMARFDWAVSWANPRSQG